MVPSRSEQGSVEDVIHALFETSILSARTSCLTLQDRCFAVWDTQHEETRHSKVGSGSTMCCARTGRQHRQCRTVERHPIVATRRPPPDGRSIEHPAHGRLALPRRIAAREQDPHAVVVTLDAARRVGSDV